MSDKYPNLFKSRYPELIGRDWIRRVEPDDRTAFVHIGLAAFDYGRQGGKVRAATAQRDERGRFTKQPVTCD